jgi:hypothetical protein
MGARTYIGNAPNLLVNAIAEERGVKKPIPLLCVAGPASDVHVADLLAHPVHPEARLTRPACCRRGKLVAHTGFKFSVSAVRTLGR